MFFNSIDFAIFLPLVFFLYWFVTNKNLKLQNILIVIASYIFYGWWDWRFLVLIVLSTFTDFLTGIFLSRQENNQKRKMLLGLSIFINISFLGFFKYCNFFIDNFALIFSFFGMKFNPYHLKIILPVGISFYTFQTMSYSIDVFNRKLEPTKDFINFAAFVSFFPQLVAGPIERATNLLSQFNAKRVFSYDNATDGCKQMLWGFFKKMVVADNCAQYVNLVFTDISGYSGSTLVLAAIFFTFQIYADFSGYSDIAIGISKLFGFRLKRNFVYPFFSRDIAEFWRRWHISLTTWFRDYIYFPLGGSKQGKLLTIRNTFIIFILSGFWHGAHWTFIMWGFVNALYFMPLLLLNKNRANIDIVAKNKLFPNIKEIVSMFSTFILTVFAFIFFRAETVKNTFKYIRKIVSFSLFSIPSLGIAGNLIIGTIFLSISLLIITEWINRKEEYGFKKQFKSRYLRFISYLFIAFVTLELAGEQQGFIYFQF
jgi:D-alanyl-lipoteichoic acid acyltransferase DltB (MBOAT superfamily)